MKWAQTTHFSLVEAAGGALLKEKIRVACCHLESPLVLGLIPSDHFLTETQVLGAVASRSQVVGE